MTVQRTDPVIPFPSRTPLSTASATGSVANMAAPASSYRASVPARPGESAAALRDRLARAAARLATMAAVGGNPPVRWILRLERGAAVTAMPLPASVVNVADGELRRRLPDAALRDVDRVVLEARARQGRRHSQSLDRPVARHARVSA